MSKNLQVRNVEESVARRLKVLAAERGESVADTIKWLVSLAPAQKEGR